MLPPRTRIPRINESLLCIDTEGLDLGFIKVGEVYKPKAWRISQGQYKGHHLDEVSFTLEGIERTQKPDGRYEGGSFSHRRFVIVPNKGANA